MIKNADGTWTSTSTKGGVTTTKTYDANNKLISSTTSNKRSGGSSSKSSSGEKVASVDYMNSDGTISTLPKSMAEQMDRNRTDGKSGIVAGSESWDKLTMGTDYRRGGTATNQETAYDFSNPNTGEKRTVYSNYTNYLDALNDAGLGDGWKLDTAVSYRKPNKTNDAYVAGTSEGGFADSALKVVQAADYLYGGNKDKLDENTKKILEGIINGTVSTAGVNFGDATTYGGLLNGSTSKGTYDNIDLSKLKDLLGGNNVKTSDSAPMSWNEYQNMYGKGNDEEVPEWNAYQEFMSGQQMGTTLQPNDTMLPSVQADRVNGNPYADLFENMQEMYGDNNEQIKDFWTMMGDLMEKRIESDREGINRQYDDAAKQAYINHQRQQFALPGQLAASGLTGGASETANINLSNNYSNNLSNINTEKVNANKELDNSILDMRNEYTQMAGEQILNNSQQVIDAYLSLGNSAIDYDYRADRDAVEDARYNEEIAYNREQDRIANEQAELNNAITLAQMGDNSKLMSLGYTSLADAIAQERAYEQQMKDLDLKSAQLAYSNKVNAGKDDGSAEEPEYFADLDELFGGNNLEYGRFYTENGYLGNIAAAIDKNWFNKDQYNAWAKARGYALYNG